MTSRQLAARESVSQTFSIFTGKTFQMDPIKKQKRYGRLYKQIQDLIVKSSNNPLSNMATINAVLYHKMDYFFWCGFYLIQEDKLQVGPYQGSLACINLAKNTGVCQAAINQEKSLVVPDVEAFPGHIACDSRAKSEIVIPLRNRENQIVGVMDVDSKTYNSFDDADTAWLEKIARLVYFPEG